GRGRAGRARCPASTAGSVVAPAANRQADEEDDARGDQQRLAGVLAHVVGGVVAQTIDVAACLGIAGTQGVDGGIVLLARRGGDLASLARRLLVAPVEVVGHVLETLAGGVQPV